MRVWIRHHRGARRVLVNQPHAPQGNPVGGYLSPLEGPEQPPLKQVTRSQSQKGRPTLLLRVDPGQPQRGLPTQCLFNLGQPAYLS